MRVFSPHLSVNKIYAYGQLSGWGLFLVLRLLITAIYVSKTPGSPVLAACVLEVVSHLLCFAWSHFVWCWLHRRRLIDRGWYRLTREGILVAYLGSSALQLLLWVPYREIYTADFARMGTHAMLWIAAGQNFVITVLWFFPLVALLYLDRVRRLELDHAEARATAREAQLRALRAQVNPHFLFNSFNSLRALIAIDPARATEALTQLSSLLRYSLADAEHLVVPLAEELQIVRRYLELEKLRLGDRLAVVADIPSQLDGALIPPMLLQGIVENAVKFGPASRKAGGEVAYSVSLADNQLRLRVTSPGHLDTASASTAIGLRNLRDRLRLLYGDAAAFDLREEPGERVVAEASLPARLPAAPVHKPAPVTGFCACRLGNENEDFARPADTADTPSPFRNPQSESRN